MAALQEPTKFIYCHGLPGSGAEIAHLIPKGRPTPRIIGPQASADFADQDAAPVHIIGFSLGAMCALKLAAQYPERTARLSLIAPAAPLELGDFLPHMAGAPVFKMAQRGALPFRLFTRLQSIGAAIMPVQILKTMFVGSPQSDLDLLTDPQFMEALKQGLRASFGRGRAAYCAAVLDYVQPWAACLAQITCPVEIYHGTADNWAPPEMASALAEAISGPAEIHRLPELGHYAALQKALPDILDA